MAAIRKVLHLRVQELSDIAAQKATGAKDSVTGTSKDVYDSVADRLTTAHKTATQQLQETRKAAEQQWTGAHTAWQKATGQHRTTSQKAWDKAQVHFLALVSGNCIGGWMQGAILEAKHRHAVRSQLLSCTGSMSLHLFACACAGAACRDQQAAAHS